MRKVLKILLIIPTLYLLFIPGYFTFTINRKLCSGIEIFIDDTSDYHFVTERHLLNVANGNSGRIVGEIIKKVQLPEVEKRIASLRELKDAEVYISADGILHVYADQRHPVMRVVPDNGGDYFVDEQGILFRVRNLYTSRLHIVGGNIEVTQDILNGVSILDTSIKSSVMRDIFQLVKYIKRDDFWSAQIDQIFVDRDDEIDLVPRAGNQLVHLGTLDNYENKLRNLAVFYEKVLPEVGWNKYSLINLEFKDQIVCKRR
jgi:cell division protein FtsQ